MYPEILSIGVENEKWKKVIDIDLQDNFSHFDLKF